MKIFKLSRKKDVFEFEYSVGAFFWKEYHRGSFDKSTREFGPEVPAEFRFDLLSIIDRYVKMFPEVKSIRKLPDGDLEISLEGRTAVGDCTVWYNKRTGRRFGTMSELYLSEIWEAYRKKYIDEEGYRRK